MMIIPRQNIIPQDMLMLLNYSVIFVRHLEESHFVLYNERILCINV